MEGHRIIKAMRLYLGMSQREAAEKLGIYLSVRKTKKLRSDFAHTA